MPDESLEGQKHEQGRAHERGSGRALRCHQQRNSEQAKENRSTNSRQRPPLARNACGLGRHVALSI
jgi:hypothetical protein